jgi:uncharacterized protein YndB with AHSA1/START domain
VAELVASADVAAAPERVWAALTDWSAHDRWMVLTRAHGGQGQGATIEAFTGVGRVGLRDPMTVLVWEPPERCVVRHTGRVVRGSGAFEVAPLPGGGSRVTWSEWLELPLGRLGRLGWPLVRPLARAGLAWSLRRLGRYAAATR